MSDRNKQDRNAGARESGVIPESEADLRKALTDASAEIAELKRELARAQSALPKDSLEHVGWYCWRCEGMVAEAPCRSDNVPLYVERSWTKDMVKEITRLQEEGQVNRNAPTE